MSQLLNHVKLAVNVSRKSSCKYHHHGAIIVRGNRVVAQGYNDENGHAEVNAVRNLYWVLQGSNWRKEP